MIISPSILSADFMNLEKEITAVEDCGVKWVHIDVMDGHFVPNITIGVPVVKSIRQKTGLFLDTHLMIENPEKYVKSFIDAGSDLITFHLEACEDDMQVREIINIIKQANKKAGISIKPKTSVEQVLPFINDVDLVLIMTVEPGFGGQEFIHECAMKIPMLKKHTTDNLIIQVDGGINNITARICTALGATSLVAGSYIYNSSNYQKAIESLQNK